VEALIRRRHPHHQARQAALPAVRAEAQVLPGGKLNFITFHTL
jgi:hypothetical protein